jgi:hypothetical protein
VRALSRSLPSAATRELPGWLVGSIVSALIACGGPAPSRPVAQRVTVHARSTDGRDVPGVRLWVDGRELGTTDAAGRLESDLGARERARVVITAACPSAYRTVDERRELSLHRVLGRAPRASAPSLQLRVSCEPLEVLAALVVRVRGDGVADLPVRVRDRVVGQTDPEGAAHLLLRGRPDSSVTVQLDTSRVPGLQPESPVQTFELGQQPSVLVFERTLTRPRPVRRSPRPALTTALRSRLPYRVD